MIPSVYFDAALFLQLNFSYLIFSLSAIYSDFTTLYISILSFEFLSFSILSKNKHHNIYIIVYPKKQMGFFFPLLNK